MNELLQLIKSIQKDKGGTLEQYENFMNEVAYHESWGTMDPTIHQVKGGPGRGLYQFEEGNHAGGITAAKRLQNYLNKKGEKVPSWLKKATSSNSLDASKLTTDQQSMLFLGNLIEKKGVDIGDLFNGSKTAADIWAKGHWAGPDKQLNTRLNSFNESLNSYNERLAELDNLISIQQDTANIEALETSLYPRDNITPPQELNPLKTPEIAPEQPNMNFDNFLNSIRTRSNNLDSFNVGGSHAANPLGGIPQGIGPNGKANTVEEGETKFDLPQGSYVFSNKMNTNGSMERGPQTIARNTTNIKMNPINMSLFGGYLKKK